MLRVQRTKLVQVELLHMDDLCFPEIDLLMDALPSSLVIPFVAVAVILQDFTIMLLRFPVILVTFALLLAEGSCRSRINVNDVNIKNPKISASIILAGSNETKPLTPLPLPPTPQAPEGEQEAAGRFMVQETGTMMCYRSWEIDSTINFHQCFVCFNETFKPETELTKEKHRDAVENCFGQYIQKTNYTECLPMLRDSTLPNRLHDIILFAEPPFPYTYQNFARCIHGVTIKEETEKCLLEKEETFLTQFSCTLRNLVAEMRRFSEANLAEILNSVPRNGTEERQEN